MGKEKRVLKYLHIKNSIIQEIADRGLKPRDQIDSVKEIMDKYQVSKVTAVRALAELANAGIISREHGRGTFVRANGGGSVVQSTRQSVAIVVPEMVNPFYAEVVGAIEKRLHGHDLIVELSCTNYQSDRENEINEKLVRERRVAGVIYIPTTSATNLHPELVQLSTVLVGLCPPELSGRCDCILSDNFQGGKAAASHLIALGHTRIGYIGLPYASPDRLNGYRYALEEANLTADPEWTLMLDLPSRLNEGLAEFIKRNKLTALFVVNDMIAMQAMQILRRNGMAVPRDVSIVGYDNIEASKHLEVPLTTIEQYEEQLGTRAADALLDQLNDSEGHRFKEVMLIPQLIIRASTAPVHH